MELEEVGLFVFLVTTKYQRMLIASLAPFRSSVSHIVAPGSGGSELPAGSELQFGEI